VLHAVCLVSKVHEHTIALKRTTSSLSDGRPRCNLFFKMHLQELLPEKRMLRHPNLAKAVGSALLARRMEQLRPDVHVFGHTHFSYDTRLGGTRYVQWPLGYPAEQRCLPARAHKPTIASCSRFHQTLRLLGAHGGQL